MLVKELVQKYRTWKDNHFDDLHSFSFRNKDALEKLEKEWKDDIKKTEDEFVIEITRETPMFVRESMINYYKNKLDELQKTSIIVYTYTLLHNINIGSDIKLEDAYGEYVLYLENEDLQEDTIINNIIKEFYIDKLIEAYNDKQKKIESYERQIAMLTGKIRQTSSITDSDIQMANEVPIESFLNIEGKRGYGNRIFIRSPLRNEKTPSFCIYKNTNSWFDYGAGEGGDAIRLVEKLYNYDFIQAVKFLTHK